MHGNGGTRMWIYPRFKNDFPSLLDTPELKFKLSIHHHRASELQRLTKNSLPRNYQVFFDPPSPTERHLDPRPMNSSLKSWDPRRFRAFTNLRSYVSVSTLWIRYSLYLSLIYCRFYWLNKNYCHLHFQPIWSCVQNIDNFSLRLRKFQDRSLVLPFWFYYKNAGLSN